MLVDSFITDKFMNNVSCIVSVERSFRMKFISYVDALNRSCHFHTYHRMETKT